MEVNGLTEEERDKMRDMFFKKIGIERKHLSKKELENEIIDYLSKKQACSLATCEKDGVPRVSVVDYMNDGLTIYIISEGGDKFKNIKKNNKVAIGIGTSAKTILSVRGINIWGVADVFTDDTPEFAKGMDLFSPIIKNIEETIGEPVKMPKGKMRLIRVTPTRMTYYHYNKGIAYAKWEAEG